MLIDVSHHICQMQIIPQPEGGIYLFLAHLRVVSDAGDMLSPDADLGSPFPKDHLLVGECWICTLIE